MEQSPKHLFFVMKSMKLTAPCPCDPRHETLFLGLWFVTTIDDMLVKVNVNVKVKVKVKVEAKVEVRK
jgi:hypothetical protein